LIRFTLSVIFFLNPFSLPPSFLIVFSGFQYAIFIHVYNLLQSYSPHHPLLSPPCSHLIPSQLLFFNHVMLFYLSLGSHKIACVNMLFVFLSFVCLAQQFKSCYTKRFQLLLHFLLSVRVVTKAHYDLYMLCKYTHIMYI
jgi:hypothetical protein